MWGHHADHPAAHKCLHVEPYREYLDYKPKPDFYLSAAKAPYPLYQELTDPALVSYYERPRVRKILLQHGIVHPKDYETIFGLSPGGTRQSTQETLRKVNLLMNTKMKRAIPERQFYPYLPAAMRRLVHAGAKMSDRRVRAAKSQLMSKPLDYVIIRLEEQLRAVKHAVYIGKQPTVAKNMKKFGFTGFVYRHTDPNKAEDVERVHALEREQEAVVHFQDRYKQAHEQHDNRSERLMNDGEYEGRHIKKGRHPTDKPKIAPRGRLLLKHRYKTKGNQTVNTQGTDPAKGDGGTQTAGGPDKTGKVPVQNYHIKMTKKFRDARLYRQAMERKLQQKLAWKPIKSKQKREQPFWTAIGKAQPKAADASAGAAPAQDAAPKKKGRKKKGHKKKRHRGPKPAADGTDTSVSDQEEAPVAAAQVPLAPVSSVAPPPAEKIVTWGPQWGPAAEHEYQGARSPIHFDPFGQEHGFRPTSNTIPKTEINVNIKDQLQSDFTLAGELHPAVALSGAELGFAEDESTRRLPPKRVSSTPSVSLLREHVALTYDPKLLKESIGMDVTDKSGLKTQQKIEMDPLPKSPSGTWQWRELQEEQEALRLAQLKDMPKHLEPAVVRLSQTEEGLYQLETESSHVDMNIPADHGHHDKQPVQPRQVDEAGHLTASYNENKLGEPLADATDVDHLASELHSFGEKHAPVTASADTFQDHAIIPIHSTHHDPREASDDVKSERMSFTYDSTLIHDENKPAKPKIQKDPTDPVHASTLPAAPVITPETLRPAPVLSQIGEPLSDATVVDHLASELHSFGVKHPPVTASADVVNDHAVIPIHDTHHAPPEPSEAVRKERLSFTYDSTHIHDENRPGKSKGQSQPLETKAPGTDPLPIPPAAEPLQASEPERIPAAEPASEPVDAPTVPPAAALEVSEVKPVASSPNISSVEEAAPGPTTDSQPTEVTESKPEPEAEKQADFPTVKSELATASSAPPGNEELPSAEAEHLASDLHSFGKSHPPRTSSPGTELDHGMIPIHENHGATQDLTEDLRKELASYESTPVQGGARAEGTEQPSPATENPSPDAAADTAPDTPKESAPESSS